MGSPFPILIQFFHEFSVYHAWLQYGAEEEKTDNGSVTLLLDFEDRRRLACSDDKDLREVYTLYMPECLFYGL